MMKTKKDLIIKAFQELDADMLDVLLNDGQTYNDVSKELFVERYKAYFESVKDDSEYDLDFQIFPGECDYCQKGKKGYSFVNKDGECLLSLIFEETDDDFSDIYSCGSFKTQNIKIENTWIGPYFYEDEKADWYPDAKELQEMQKCERGLKELNEELANEGILTAKFYVPWFDTYGEFDSIKNLFNKNNYKYSQEIRLRCSDIKRAYELYEENRMAEIKMREFLKFNVIDENTVSKWLTECNELFSSAKFSFFNDFNIKLNYFESGKLDFQLDEVYWSMVLYDVVHTYAHWLPQEDANGGYWSDDDEDLPF